MSALSQTPSLSPFASLRSRLIPSIHVLRRASRRVAIAAAAMLVTASALDAQELATGFRPRVSAGGGVIVSVPVGEFDDYIDLGGGIGGQATLGVPGSPLELRLDGGFVVYGTDKHDVCLSQNNVCRADLDLRTNNMIAMVQIGPQLTGRLGFLQAYAHAGVGGTYFVTESSLSTDDDDWDGDSDALSITEQDDFTGSWSAGGGLMVPLRLGSVGLSLDLGARYVGNGRAEYLREGSIVENPDGSISIHPIRSEANFVVAQLGLRVQWAGSR